MKPKAVTKIVVDVLMTLALLFLMGYPIWGEEAHEWGGAGALILFIAHHILNGSWYKKLPKGKYTPMRVFMVCVDVLVFAAMCMQMYSGIVMSRHVFAFLPLSAGLSLARKLHILGAYWGFILMSVHLGLHWNKFLNIAVKGARLKRPSRIRRIIFSLMGLSIASYGIYVFFTRDFLTYMFLQSQFVFFDYEEPALLFYMDYLSLMGLWIFLSHYFSMFLRKLGDKKKNSSKNI